MSTWAFDKMRQPTPGGVPGIYVDHMIPTIKTRQWRYPRGCHLFHIDNDLDALHAFAERLVLQRRWLHTVPGFPHYDLTDSMRDLAVYLGAAEMDWRSDVGRAFMQRRRDALAGADRPGA